MFAEDISEDFSERTKKTSPRLDFRVFLDIFEIFADDCFLLRSFRKFCPLGFTLKPFPVKVSPEGQCSRIRLCYSYAGWMATLLQVHGDQTKGRRQPLRHCFGMWASGGGRIGCCYWCRSGPGGGCSRFAFTCGVVHGSIHALAWIAFLAVCLRVVILNDLNLWALSRALGNPKPLLLESGHLKMVFFSTLCSVDGSSPVLVAYSLWNCLRRSSENWHVECQFHCEIPFSDVALWEAPL